MPPTKIELLSDLWSMANTLGSDELEALNAVARGLVTGRHTYGELDVANDPRDFKAEAFQEVRDALVYLGAQLVKLQKGNG